MAGALIVTAELGPADFAWLDGLRRTHYPSERNRLPAHLTRVKQAHASIQGLMDLGGGVAFRVISPELDRIRDELSHDLRGLVGAQDTGGWRPHVTIQNKVAPKIARDLIADLQREFRPRPLAISGLGLHRYLDGPWEKLAIYPFRGG